MTRDEILSMPPGREMDALVAEKVMGWVPHHRNTVHYVEAAHERAVGYYRICAIVGEWHPSYDIASAWEVVLLLVVRGYHVEVTEVPPYRGHDELLSACRVLRHDDHEVLEWRAAADDAPHAICRASLLAVMERGE